MYVHTTLMGEVEQAVVVGSNDELVTAVLLTCTLLCISDGINIDSKRRHMCME